MAACHINPFFKVDECQTIVQSPGLLLGAGVLANFIRQGIHKAKITVQPLPQAINGVGKAAVEIVHRVGEQRTHMLKRADAIDSLWQRDRKSTRLNSSHVSISYAVFCLKKKKT